MFIVIMLHLNTNIEYHKKTKVRTNYSYYDGRVRNDGVDYDRIRDRSGRIIEKRNIITYSTPIAAIKGKRSEQKQ